MSAGYDTYAYLDNRLVPFSPGTTTLDISFAASRNTITLAVRDTYQDTWPQGQVLNDTALSVTANMTQGYQVFMLAQPSVSMDLALNPPSPDDVIKGEYSERGS